MKNHENQQEEHKRHGTSRCNENSNATWIPWIIFRQMPQKPSILEGLVTTHKMVSHWGWFMSFDLPILPKKADFISKASYFRVPDALLRELLCECQVSMSSSPHVQTVVLAMTPAPGSKMDLPFGTRPHSSGKWPSRNSWCSAPKLRWFSIVRLVYQSQRALSNTFNLEQNMYPAAFSGGTTGWSGLPLAAMQRQRHVPWRGKGSQTLGV